MRVLYTNHTAEVSGSERSLLSLLAALPASVEPRVATPPGPLATAAAELGVPVSKIAATAGSLRLHPAHTPRALVEMSTAAVQIRRLARAHAADLVHANSIRAGIELGLGRLAPSVVCVRDCLPAGRASTATMRLIGASATTVVANSGYTAESVRRLAPRARLEVVHPGIDSTAFDPARIGRAQARARLGWPADGPVLLGVVAQLSPWKGQDTAIEALALLRGRGIDAHLLLIGSPKFVARSTRFDNHAYVTDLHRLVSGGGLDEHVSWLGERKDVPELIRALDVVLVPSHEEPFGRALLEALALEVPVVATSVGGPPELVRDGREGYLAPPRNADAWAQAVLRVIEAPERGRALGRAGRVRIAEGFDAASHADAWFAVYERTLAVAAGR
jgi:glycosyltransferase involved in cell wall biosynthesis